MSNDFQCHDSRISTCRVDLEVIGAEVVDSIDFHVLSAFASSSVAARAFAALDLVE
jgi:hypothetical protein